LAEGRINSKEEEVGAVTFLLLLLQDKKMLDESKG